VTQAAAADGVHRLFTFMSRLVTIWAACHSQHIHNVTSSYHTSPANQLTCNDHKLSLFAWHRSFPAPVITAIITHL